MADEVSTQVLVNNARRLVLKLTSQSDGTGESLVTKVDVSTYSASKVRIKKIKYNVVGMLVTLFWGATTNVPICYLEGDGTICDEKEGGIINNAGTGVTGDLLLSTGRHTDGDSYTIILEMTKVPL